MEKSFFFVFTESTLVRHRLIDFEQKIFRTENSMYKSVLEPSQPSIYGAIKRNIENQRPFREAIVYLQLIVPFGNECVYYFPGGGQHFENSTRTFFVPQKSLEIKWNERKYNYAFFEIQQFRKGYLDSSNYTSIFQEISSDVKLTPKIIK